MKVNLIKIKQRERGSRFFSDGSYYIGEFSDGYRAGKGKLFDKNGKLIYEGDYKLNKYHGKGALYLKTKKYIGDFVGGKKHGKGKLYNRNDLLEYDGDWRFNKKVGNDTNHIEND